jgi:hypothetical protein
LARWAAVLLVPGAAAVASASDCCCSGSEHSYLHGHGQVYSREANHGLMHYPHATYWGSGDGQERWGAADHPGYSPTKVAPSPWAYHSITPYARHYHFFYGSSYGWGGCFDCRN